MDMNMSSSSMMSDQMQMTFFTSTATSLYSIAWTPSSTGQYAGTCIFLILLAAIFRGLFAMRAIQERKNAHAELRRQTLLQGGRNKRNNETKSSNSSLDGVASVTLQQHTLRPWRLSTDVPRALLDTVIAGVGYLLMLAVMTFNVGYYLSVLGGVFLGSLIAGRYASVPFGLH